VEIVAALLLAFALAAYLRFRLINAFVGAFAMLGAWGLIYHGVYRVFNLEDKGQSLLMAGSVLAVGLVAWVALMVLTLVVWGYA